MVSLFLTWLLSFIRFNGEHIYEFVRYLDTIDGSLVNFILLIYSVLIFYMNLLLLESYACIVKLKKSYNFVFNIF